MAVADLRRERRLAVERFRAYLWDNGLKFTPERAAVVREFASSRDHIEADELLLRLRRSDSRVSRSTIYRTLDLLVQAGLVRRVRLGADHYYYEHILGREQHEHMICLGCDRIIEWYDPELRGVLARNFREQGFHPTRHSLQFYGYCDCCASSEEARAALERAEDAHILEG